ncbi:uncharacterized protein PAF06_016335 [Gastrophryne carolinensis]
MTVCSMFGCKNRMHKGCGKHFFRFPLKDPERLEKWIEAVQRDDWKPTLHSKVCSDHFTEKDYMIRPGAACPYLRVDAVPTPLVIVQRKKKTKKRKHAKDADTSVSSEAEPAKKLAKDNQAEGIQETPTKGQEPGEECGTPPRMEKVTEGQENEARGTQDTEVGTQTYSGEQVESEKASAEIERDQWATRGWEQETPGGVAPSGNMTTNNSLIDGMAGISLHKEATQSERQVALILAGLEDTHCEMQAAEEARAAREAASSDNDSSIDNVPEYIPFDHAYTTLTASDKENDTPAPTPAMPPTPASTPAVNPRVVKLRKKIKTLQKQVLRQGVKIRELKQNLVELRKDNLVEKDPERVIAEHCSGLALALFSNQMKNRQRKCSALQYTNQLKDFALNLYCASPKAYKFCRLFLSLPHPVSLRHWKNATETGQGAAQEEAAQLQGDLLQATLSQSGALQGMVLQNDTVQAAEGQQAQ